MTEAQLQTAVIECARILGWRVAHFRPAQTAKGWRTPVEADGAGFPDLILAHPTNGTTVYAVELKSDRGVVSEAQWEWLRLFENGGCYTDVWRPADWTSGRVEALLRQRRETPGDATPAVGTGGCVTLSTPRREALGASDRAVLSAGARRGTPPSDPSGTVPNVGSVKQEDGMPKSRNARS